MSLLDLRGDVISAFELDVPNRPVTEFVRQSWIDGMVQRTGTDESRAHIEVIADRILWPSVLPVFSSMIVDQLGYLWLQEYAPPVGRSGRWIVVDARGTVVARAVVPVDFLVRYVHADELVGLWVAGPNAIQIRAHRLDRKGRGTHAAAVPSECR